MFCKDLLCSCFHFGSKTFICMFNFFAFGHARPLCLLSSRLQCIQQHRLWCLFLDISVGVGIDSHFLFSHHVHLFSPSGDLSLGRSGTLALSANSDGGEFSWIRVEPGYKIFASSPGCYCWNGLHSGRRLHPTAFLPLVSILAMDYCLFHISVFLHLTTAFSGRMHIYAALHFNAYAHEGGDPNSHRKIPLCFRVYPCDTKWD